MSIEQSTNSRLAWWQAARFGMFVHWGIYSATNQDCWRMADMGTPMDEYARRYEPQFTGEHFDADQLVALAKDAGCRYIVLTTRHHDGYCLWNTATTPYNSVRMTPRRDFVAEYVAAARKAGLGVGMYFSLLDWRYKAYWLGPRHDPKAWASFVDYVHAQVRELMTQYGKIDILWYDGGWPPHHGTWDYQPSNDEVAAAWRSSELNAMVRRHQPDILINNRSFLPEDFGTPEKKITPEARPWELCDTMGYYWGASRFDLDRKSAEHILTRLCYCASHGGNMLLNVGPQPDGRVPQWQQQTLRELGAWLSKFGQCIYETQGESQFPLNEGLAPWNTTRRDDRLYLILLRYPGSDVAIATQHNYELLEAKLLGVNKPLQIVHEPTRDRILGLPDEPTDPLADVIECRVRRKPHIPWHERPWIGVDDPDALMFS